jgi:hypothetical protein
MIKVTEKLPVSLSPETDRGPGWVFSEKIIISKNKISRFSSQEPKQLFVPLPRTGINIVIFFPFF